MANEVLMGNESEMVAIDSPEFSPQIKNIIDDMLCLAKEIEVKDESSYKKLTSLYRDAKDWKKNVETKRKYLVEPLRKQTSYINDKAREITDPLDLVIDLANSKTGAYMKLLEKAKQNEEQRLKDAASLFDAEDELYIPPMEKIIRGEGAIAITKTKKCFKVTDISKVPVKYLQVCEKAVEQDIKLGMLDIPGLEIFEEQITQLRVR